MGLLPIHTLLTCRVAYTPSQRVDYTLSVLRKPVPHVGVRGMQATVTGAPLEGTLVTYRVVRAFPWRLFL